MYKEKRNMLNEWKVYKAWEARNRMCHSMEANAIWNGDNEEGYEIGKRKRRMIGVWNV